MSEKTKAMTPVTQPDKECQPDENQPTASDTPPAETGAISNGHDSDETNQTTAPFEIDPEFQSLLPALTAEEKAGLAAKIEETGHVDDLVVLGVEGKRLLGDGHNRNEICLEKGIPFKTRDLPMKSRADAIEWIVANQLSKRNLTDEQRAYYIGKSYLNAKQKEGGDRKSGSLAQNEQVIGPTAETIAKKHGVSAATVRRDAEFAEAVDAVGVSEGPAAKEEILSGKSGKTKAEVIAKKPKARKRAVAGTTQVTGEEKTDKPASDDGEVIRRIKAVLVLIHARGKALGKGELFDRCVNSLKDAEEAFKQWQADRKGTAGKGKQGRTRSVRAGKHKRPERGGGPE